MLEPTGSLISLVVLLLLLGALLFIKNITKWEPFSEGLLIHDKASKGKVRTADNP
jgi:hypothetical protein